MGADGTAHKDGEEPPRERREAILDAAARLISKSGVRGLRVEEVASEAKVSPPLLYYHFASRSGLIRAALEHASEHAPSTALRSSPPEGPDGYSAVLAALLAELDDDRTVRDNAIVWGEVSATAVFEPALREDVRRVVDEWSAAVQEGIRRGLADGSIRKGVDAERSAEILISLVDGLCTRWLAGALEREQARELLEAAIEGLLA
ncbi:TetR/AcrR family transcriptional regulator [soil metagenome]